MKPSVAIAAAFALAAFAVPALSAELKVTAADSLETVLAAQKGKRVTLKLRSGQEATGTVAAVTPKVVQVSALAGKEFFDAVVPLEAVEAVLVRTKD